MPALVSLPDGDAVGVCHQQNHRTLKQWDCDMSMTKFTNEAAALCANFDCPDYLVQQERGSMQYQKPTGAEDAESALTREQPVTAAAATPTPVNNESAGAEGAEFIAQDLSQDPPGNDDLLPSLDSSPTRSIVNGFVEKL